MPRVGRSNFRMHAVSNCALYCYSFKPIPFYSMRCAMRVIVVVGLAAALAACQTAYQGDENSPYYVVPVGSQLVLHKEINFNPDQVSVYIQYGKVLPFNSISKYDPFCKFELNHRVSTARTIAPSEMRVTKAFQQQTYDMFVASGRIPHAQLTAGHMAQSGGFDGGPSLEAFIEQMDLESPTQPEVFRMTCARWAVAPGYRHNLSIAEIRRALDPLFTLRAPAGG
jgi:hypothetical protein